MKKGFFYFFYFCVIVLFSACQGESNNNTPTNKFDYGKIENQVYSNQFFNFKMDVPPSWHVTTHEEMAEITGQGMDLVAGKETETEKMVEAAKIATAQLLNISQFPINSNVANNATLIVTVDNISEFPEIRDGKDYLISTKETFSAMGMELELTDDISEKILSNQTFHQLGIKISFPEGSISQQYISAVKKDFIFNIVLTYGNEEGKVALEKILNSYKIL